MKVSEKSEVTKKSLIMNTSELKETPVQESQDMWKYRELCNKIGCYIVVGD